VTKSAATKPTRQKSTSEQATCAHPREAVTHEFHDAPSGKWIVDVECPDCGALRLETHGIDYMSVLTRVAEPVVKAVATHTPTSPREPDPLDWVPELRIDWP
jgi:hypothetical protein